MARRWWIWLLAVGFIPLLVWGLDRHQKMRWVGNTDLEVEFVVTAAETGQPIPGARIDIISEGGLYEKRPERDFTLVADDGGKALEVCRRSMCFGTRSFLGFTDTFAVHLPRWLFRVSAPGFESTDWMDLDILELRKGVRRAGPGKARLLVPVAL
jgi:hypothetical protein